MKTLPRIITQGEFTTSAGKASFRVVETASGPRVEESHHSDYMGVPQWKVCDGFRADGSTAQAVLSHLLKQLGEK